MLKFLLITVMTFTWLGTYKPTMVNRPETRLKSIISSDYNSELDKFSPVKKRIINYSQNYTHLEYVEYNDGTDDSGIFEKIVAAYEKNKLTSLSMTMESETKIFYKYNQLGDLINQEYIGSDGHHQDTLVYRNNNLISRKEYFYKDILNKTLISEIKYYYDSKGNAMKKVNSTSSDTITTEFTYDSQNRVISKSKPYEKYKITYEGNTSISIVKSEGADFERQDMKTTISYNQKGQLIEVTGESPYLKTSFQYSYNENNSVAQMLNTVEYQNGTKQYSKTELGPYNLDSNFILPSWFINCEGFASSLVRDINSFLDERRLNDDLINIKKEGRIIKTFPDYFIRYKSEDGINWMPEARMDFEFITSGK